MDTTGRIFGAAATKHFESASTSERNQRAAEQRVRVAIGTGGGYMFVEGNPAPTFKFYKGATICQEL